MSAPAVCGEEQRCLNRENIVDRLFLVDAVKLSGNDFGVLFRRNPVERYSPRTIDLSGVHTRVRDPETTGELPLAARSVSSDTGVTIVEPKELHKPIGDLA